MTDAHMEDKGDTFDLERAAEVFATQFLRHMAGGSSRYELVRSMQDLHDAMVSSENWTAIANVVTRVWRIQQMPFPESHFDQLDYWMHKMKVPAFRLAAAQFSFNPIQTRLAKEDMQTCIDNLENTRKEIRMALR